MVNYDYLMFGFRFSYDCGHVTVYRNGKFFGTADTISEALNDIREDIKERPEMYGEFK